MNLRAYSIKGVILSSILYVLLLALIIWALNWYGWISWILILLITVLYIVALYLFVSIILLDLLWPEFATKSKQIWKSFVFQMKSYLQNR